MPYATPGMPPPGAVPDQRPADTTQIVYDTVVGPNVRLKDNLIQLVCCVVGAAIGGGAGAVFAPSGERSVGVLIGVFVGLLVSVLLSGAVIGIVRFVTAVKRK
jgi:hypothetical protein